MSVYQTALGALIAALIAWASIIVVVRINLLKHLDEKVFRLFGALAIASISLMMFGVEIPAIVPLALTFSGIAVAFVIGYSRHR